MFSVPTSTIYRFVVSRLQDPPLLMCLNSSAHTQSLSLSHTHTQPLCVVAGSGVSASLSKTAFVFILRNIPSVPLVSMLILVLVFCRRDPRLRLACATMTANPNRVFFAHAPAAHTFSLSVSLFPCALFCYVLFLRVFVPCPCRVESHEPNTLPRACSPDTVAGFDVIRNSSFINNRAGQAMHFHSKIQSISCCMYRAL